MFGKHFGSMYEGSMVGAGAVVFAVMGYVIAKQMPDKKVGSQVRLNPVLLAAILGEDTKAIEAAIEKLCAPDPKSTTKTNDGRRLVKLGEFDYQVVNGAKYRAIRDEETRQEQNRVAQRAFRERQQPGQTLRQHIAAQVAADPVTRADAATLRKQRRRQSHASNSDGPTKATAEYDQDHGDEAGNGADSATGRDAAATGAAVA